MELIEFIESNLANTTNLNAKKQFSEALSDYFNEVRNQLSNLNPENNLYKEIIKRLPSDFTHIESTLIKIIDLYNLGNQIDSIKLFDDLAEWLDKYYWNNKGNLDLSEFPKIMNAVPRFYRCRAVSKTGNENLGSILHIPFEAREHAALGRFNLAGMPCLYLGKSIHSCWEELNRPLLNNIIGAKFQIKEGVDYKIINLSDLPFVNYYNFELHFFIVIFQICKFLIEKEATLTDEINNIIQQITAATEITFHEPIDDIIGKLEKIIETKYIINDLLIKKGHTYERIFNLFHYNIKEEIYPLFSENDGYLSVIQQGQNLLQTSIAKLINELIVHPIQIAVSFKVKNYNHPYKVEYVISQFLMQWLFKKNQQEEKLYGLSYLSSRIPEHAKKRLYDLNLYKNYVFPSIPQKEGYCPKLIQCFQVSSIVNYDDTINSIKTDSFNKEGRIYSYSVNGFPYRETFLYEIEMYLEESPMHDLNNLKL